MPWINIYLTLIRCEYVPSDYTSIIGLCLTGWSKAQNWRNGPSLTRSRLIVGLDYHDIMYGYTWASTQAHEPARYDPFKQGVH
jgi:hypothetical protein